ncbi:hypothetical protein [Spongiactinospora sp. TRM90649]|uniref:hypothetical protein n=1 Tax=Spongiactinospora sp. TRM90649 TaxID=3031114 RepID=UPI0023F71DA0|nr:hypothetical protein [Spongiactinospora sp. TRM90649]MDF5758171.1 hypothetical protein [Spongiactinospora sp. TRM90649]
MNRLRTSATAAAAIIISLVGITSTGTANAASAPLSQPGSGTEVSTKYPGCEVSYEDPQVVNGKVRFTGTARCAESAPATVDWLVIWLTPRNDAPYEEWFGDEAGSKKSHSASSTVPCVSGTYQGSIFASLYGDEGGEHVWVDREVTITC